ncbi:hypothetical protein [Paraburkholderia sp. WSM4174]|uniref:cyanobactin maturation protease PatG family protein n=1 Tax=Paraburkholderia TaxID=1822464 RepID=UPI003D210F24
MLESNSVSDLPYVYALGVVEAVFPRLGVEKEFAQATGRNPESGKTDRQVFYEVLKKHENRYLARKLCWKFTIQGVDTYLLLPRDPQDFELLIEAIGGPAQERWVSLVIGVRGPIASSEMCNGLMVPIVAVDQIYSFSAKSLVEAIPRPENPPEQFETAASELFDRTMQMTDNAGATDEHRALNYLVVRYPAVYETVARAYERNASLTRVEVRPSVVSGTRKILDVIYTFTYRDTGVEEKFYVPVDVTDEFPFLNKKMSPYYDR